ncbi:arginine biosynthesis ArgJ [Coprinopsis cinerea okayama7|uniref:Arginine biosynthesis bifunctional protein ArgJ, mitochondrial n=1 Tax=Coprinopsis cinerea (strain Okayama-7 / 130 / ATCC MYA-4618 / FGSC 9003) TaxID=240176 RepID=ARGJ_COPC7|nr:arginine biosynthesis ArgJ [Coprinopsis cinerea okayama7\|eukprot:XP_001831884.1 arginine biosynthesis ArgJ [Coprinopsis cinerea okayama7\
MSAPFIFKRFSSTIPIHSKPTPSKAHLHFPLPSSSFPKGYVLTGIHAGVKKVAGVPDLAVILSTSSQPTSAAACFTRNAFKAAPVIVSNEILKKNGGYARGVVVNSGCANAVTGKQGMEDAWAMVRETDALLPSKKFEHETLVMSTGVIGQNLPISKIVEGIRSQAESSSTRSLASDFSAWERAAKAFMTTDTFPKLRSRTFTIDGVEYKLAGMDKGAGMIHPDMGPAGTEFKKQLHATLLGCILTDAAVSPRSLQSALTYAVDRSFNSISVDGDMSTNDSIYVLANGAASSSIIDEDATPQAYEAFKQELTTFAADLAKLVVRDGEGATKFVTVTVKGAPSYKDAHSIASRISTSALVKTALYGEDANWGRILAATGSVPLSPTNANTPPPVIDTTKVCVTIVPADGTAPLPVLVNGEPENVDEDRAKEIMTQEDFELLVDLGGMGDGEAQYWTCDFSYEYVRINGDYRS